MTDLVDYMERNIDAWNRFPERVDTTYDVKMKRSESKISVYKVGMMGGDKPTWNFLFSVEKNEAGYAINLMLDVNTDLIDMLRNDGYPYHPHMMFYVFDIEKKNEREVKDFLEHYVWPYDPGYFY